MSRTGIHIPSWIRIQKGKIENKLNYNRKMQQIVINSFNGCKFVNICNINLVKLNPDPHGEKQLDPDPQKMTADPQPWSHT